MSIDRQSLQFAMSVVMSGTVHQLQVVRVARYILQHPGETWLFNYQANPKTLYVYTDPDWAADELTRKSVSCTVGRYGSHMLGGRVLRHCQGRGDVKANLTGLGTDRNARGGDDSLRQQCGESDLHENGIRKGTTPFNQRVADTGGLS